jgi:hypothetical protein
LFFLTYINYLPNIIADHWNWFYLQMTHA